MASYLQNDILSGKEEYKQLRDFLNATFQMLHSKLDERESVLSNSLETVYNNCVESEKERLVNINKLKLACETFLSSIQETNLLTTDTLTLKPIQDQIHELELKNQKVHFEYSTSSMELAIAEFGGFVIAYEDKCEESDNNQHYTVCNVEKEDSSDVIVSKVVSVEKIPNAVSPLCGLYSIHDYSHIKSILQCLAHTQALAKYFTENSVFESSVSGGTVHVELFKVLFDGLCSDTHNNLIYREEILHKFVRLTASNDACIFLDSLLSCLHKEMNSVVSVGIDMHESVSHDNEVSQLAWNLHSLSNQSIISETFHGQYKSILTCKDCESQTFSFKVFNCLRLPFNSTCLRAGNDFRTIKITLVVIDPLSKLITLEVVTKKTALISELCHEVSAMSGIDSDKLVVCDVYSHRFHKIFAHDERVTSITDRDDIFIFETPINCTNDPNTICLPVYNRDLRRTRYTSMGTHSYVHHYLFGLPLILPIPRDSTTYADLYRVFIYFMQRYIDIVSIPFFNSLPIGSVETGHVPDNFNISVYPSDMFQIKLVNAYGSAEMGTLKNDGKALVLTNKSVLALEWNSEYTHLYSESKLRESTSTFSHANVSRYIQLYLDNTLLSETESIDCSKCKQKQVYERKELWILPECLIIQLKRLQNNKWIFSQVDYPFELDMSEFICSDISSPSQYDLYAVCNHYGSIEGGHYTASIKHTDGEWYCIDDSSVMRYLYQECVISSAANILFYKRRA